MSKGYSSQTKLDRLKSEFETVEPIRAEQNGKSVLAHQYVYLVATDAVEASSTTSVINATSHVALKGDVIRLTSGALSGREVKVWSISTNAITLAEDLPSAPATSVTFEILRHKYPVVSSRGDASFLDVVDFLDTPLLVASSTNIPASASSPVTVVASLAAPVKRIRALWDGTAFIGVYSDPAGSPVLEAIVSGTANEIDVYIPAGTVIGLRNMANAAINSGNFALNFLG